MAVHKLMGRVANTSVEPWRACTLDVEEAHDGAGAMDRGSLIGKNIIG